MIERRLLGELLHGYFENYASDENLPAEHWFWDRAKSGGIFVEHGVHFFDMFAGWLGAGEVVAAQASRRAGTNIEDQVQCTVRYGDGVHVNFYHGFTAAGPDGSPGAAARLRTRRLAAAWAGCRRTRALHAIADEAATRALCELFPGGRIDALAAYGAEGSALRAGTGASTTCISSSNCIGARGGRSRGLYCELLRGFMTDQVAWIRDRSSCAENDGAERARFGRDGVCGGSDWRMHRKLNRQDAIARLQLRE